LKIYNPDQAGLFVVFTDQASGWGWGGSGEVGASYIKLKELPLRFVILTDDVI